LKNVYGLNFKDFKPLDAGGPLTVAALDGKQIDVGLLFTSDPTIVAKSFVLLDDDKHLQLSDNIAAVVRDDLLAKDDGTIKRLLTSISAKLSQEELNGMNKQVSVDKMDPKDVAKAWLKKQGLIK
jgi:osmoprotectant transport system substrate-binding protein